MSQAQLSTSRRVAYKDKGDIVVLVTETEGKKGIVYSKPQPMLRYEYIDYLIDTGVIIASSKVAEEVIEALPTLPEGLLKKITW